MTAEPYSDEEIVAFLDEEMADDEQVRFARAANEDEGFAARIEALIIDTDALRDTFDTLLNDAPFIPVHEAMPYTEETRGAGTSRGVRHWGAGRMALAALVLLGLGIALGMIIANRFEPRDWHSAVLAHQSLYGAETLNAIPVAARVAELSDASAALGITLPPSALEIDGLVYARAHVFEFESRSLVRIAYLTPNEQPAALYLMMTGGQDAPPAISTHQMMATVKWQRNGYGFILVGRADQDVLRAAQVQLASQISL